MARKKRTLNTLEAAISPPDIQAEGIIPEEASSVAESIFSGPVVAQEPDPEPVEAGTVPAGALVFDSGRIMSWANMASARKSIFFDAVVFETFGVDNPRIVRLVAALVLNHLGQGASFYFRDSTLNSLPFKEYGFIKKDSVGEYSVYKKR